MKTIRIIPRLDIKGPNLVKGIHLEGLRVLGKPKQFAQFYYEHGADELFFQDVVASLYGRNNLNHLIEEMAKDIFIPITVGGGIRTLNDIENLLKSGADKVAINTAGVANPSFLKEASLRFGSSTIVGTIEAIKSTPSSYYAFTDNGREETGLEVVTWAQRMQDLGVGELVLTSVDKEGTGKGFDVDLIKNVVNAVSIPLIIHGGAGSINDFETLLEETSIDSIAAASVFHYETIKHINFEEHDFLVEGNLDFLKSGKELLSHKPVLITKLKDYLVRKEYNCRRND